MPKGKQHRKPASSLSKDEWGFVARFFLSFFILYAALLGIDHFFPTATLLFKVFVARSSSILLAAYFGTATSISGTVIFSGNSLYSIVVECTGLVLAILLFSLLYASKLSPQKIAFYLAAYMPFLLAFNVFRVSLTIAIGIFYGQDAMDAVHVTLWLVDSALVMALWMRATGIRIGAGKNASSRRL